MYLSIYLLMYSSFVNTIGCLFIDYCELFKAWFGDNIDQKIIESAIIFWFKDDDYEEGSKLWNYFKEN